MLLSPLPLFIDQPNSPWPIVQHFFEPSLPYFSVLCLPWSLVVTGQNLCIMHDEQLYRYGGNELLCVGHQDEQFNIVVHAMGGCLAIQAWNSWSKARACSRITLNDRDTTSKSLSLATKIKMDKQSFNSSYIWRCQCAFDKIRDPPARRRVNDDPSLLNSSICCPLCFLHKNQLLGFRRPQSLVKTRECAPLRPHHHGAYRGAVT